MNPAIFRFLTICLFLAHKQAHKKETHTHTPTDTDTHTDVTKRSNAEQCILFGRRTLSWLSTDIQQHCNTECWWIVFTSHKQWTQISWMTFDKLNFGIIQITLAWGGKKSNTIMVPSTFPVLFSSPEYMMKSTVWHNEHSKAKVNSGVIADRE